MGLPPARVRSYLCGALAGELTVVALLGRRDGSQLSWPALVAALVCGALSVAYEEAAQRT